MISLICRLENRDVPFFERKVGHNVEHSIGQPLERMVNRNLSDRLFQRVVQHLSDPLILTLSRERELMTYRDCAIPNYSAQDRKRIVDRNRMDESVSVFVGDKMSRCVPSQAPI